MPSTINGFGTMYYGKNNLRIEEGICEFCGFQGNLSSYDTGYFVTLFFVPFIPIGAQHIMCECPSCKKHQRLSVRKLQRLKENTLRTIRTELEKSVPDSAIVLENLRSLYTFNDVTAFNSIAYLVVEKCKSRVPVLNEIAELYCHFHDAEQALGCALLAQKLSDTPTQHELTAEMLLYNKKPVEAERYLQHIWEEGTSETYWLAAFLVEGYCAIGDYSAADRIYAEVEKSFTGEEFSASLSHIKERVEKGKKSGEVSYSSRITKVGEPFPLIQQVKNRAMLIAPLIMLGLFCIYLLISLFMQFRKEVYLVNGTAKKYTLTLNGKNHTLQPFSSRKIHLAEGEYTLITPDLDSVRNTQHFTLRSSLLRRPLGEAGKTYVINPDQCALLYEMDIEYGEYASAEPVYRYRSLGFKHVFHGVDFDFSTIPDSIEMSSSARVETKTALNIIRDLGDISPVIPAFSVLSPDSAREFVKRYTTIVPRDITALNSYVESDTGEAFTFLEHLLDETPIYVEAHRTYQSIMTVHNPEYDLYAAYLKRLAKDSLNPDLLYLTGRSAPDSEAERYFEKATNQKNPSAYAFNALAIAHHNRQEFTEAINDAQKAYKQHRQNGAFLETYMASLHGAKEFENVLALVEKQLLQEPLDLQLQLYKFELLLSLKRVSDAEKGSNIYFRELERNGYGDIESYKNSFKIYRAIFDGDREGLQILYQTDPYYTFYNGLLSANYNLCDDAFNSGEQKGHASLLLAYIISQKRGEKSVATRFLKRAIKEMQVQGAYYRDFVSLLEGRGKERGERDDFYSLYTEKALFYTALGMRYPSKKEFYFSKARAFNYRVSLQKSILDVVL